MQLNRVLLVLSFVLAGVSIATAQMATMSDQEATASLQGAAPQSVVESRPDRGVALVRIVTRNQRDEVVQVLVAKLIVPRRT
jgi:hypothetical protein